MAEFDIAFGEKLAVTAAMVVGEGVVQIDAQRTALYLGLLSIEITLKAMLEHAGKSVAEIRAHSHRLGDLLSDVGQCEVEVEIAHGIKQFVPASRLRSCSLKHGTAEITVGTVLDAERHGASKYPNNVRYGDVLCHFPAEVVVQMASVVTAFARDHWQSLRIRRDSSHDLS
jgi:hypothetical protein